MSTCETITPEHAESDDVITTAMALFLGHVAIELADVYKIALAPRPLHIDCARRS